MCLYNIDLQHKELAWQRIILKNQGVDCGEAVNDKTIWCALYVEKPHRRQYTTKLHSNIHTSSLWIIIGKISNIPWKKGI